MILERDNNGDVTIEPDNDNGKVVADAVCDPDTGTYTITTVIADEDAPPETTNVQSVRCDDNGAGGGGK